VRRLPRQGGAVGVTGWLVRSGLFDAALMDIESGNGHVVTKLGERSCRQRGFSLRARTEAVQTASSV
jgi:hypothetical protein